MNKFIDLKLGFYLFFQKRKWKTGCLIVIT